MKEKKHCVALKAAAIGYRVLDILKSPGHKTVVQGVFDHAIYIGAGGDTLVKVISDEEFIGPATIVLEKPEGLSFRAAGIKEGTEIIADEGGLSAEGSGFIIKLESASVWHPPRLPETAASLSLEEISLNLRVLHDVIYTCPSREGLVPLMENIELYGPMEVFLKEQKPTVSERARPYIERLMWGLLFGDHEAVLKNSEPILGLGPGLTPSCDDFLAGLILSLNLGTRILPGDGGGSPDFFNKVSEGILGLAKGKTTVYSVSFLSESALGEAPWPAMGLIYALFTKSSGEVAKLSKTLIGMGETSGADIAIGICYGIRFLISRIELKELNETA